MLKYLKYGHNVAEHEFIQFKIINEIKIIQVSNYFYLFIY
jgi:hypothetical protein